MLKHFGVEDYA